MDNEQLFGEDTELRRHEATSRVWRQVVPFHVTTVAEAHVDARSQHQVEESNAVFPIEDFDYDENNDFSVDSDSNSRRPAKGGFVALLLSMSPVRDGGIDGDDDDIADTVLETVAVIDGGDGVGVGGDSGDDVGVDDGDRGADDAAFGDERSGSFDNDSDQDLSDTDYEPLRVTASSS
ncbi:hypothetical protein L914_13846 [Phytophthora nicotianae]|uniref:Uncharacterized protein n=1 Tax=Phytophthora nicotianae TaxID=4792 RepID=W2MWS3_PHYNI|nr:hypothetical protein L914_13846 [Phytophthora nicotianae]